MIKRIVTARGANYDLYTVFDCGMISSIEFIGGDYELSSRACYRVNFDTGASVDVYDAVEVWRDPEPEHDGSDPRDVVPTAARNDDTEIHF
jgi:hypothetical protein